MSEVIDCSQPIQPPQSLGFITLTSESKPDKVNPANSTARRRSTRTRRLWLQSALGHPRRVRVEPPKLIILYAALQILPFSVPSCPSPSPGCNDQAGIRNELLVNDRRTVRQRFEWDVALTYSKRLAFIEYRKSVRAAVNRL